MSWHQVKALLTARWAWRGPRRRAPLWAVPWPRRGAGPAPMAMPETEPRIHGIAAVRAGSGSRVVQAEDLLGVTDEGGGQVGVGHPGDRSIAELAVGDAKALREAARSHGSSSRVRRSEAHAS